MQKAVKKLVNELSKQEDMQSKSPTRYSRLRTTHVRWDPLILNVDHLISKAYFIAARCDAMRCISAAYAVMSVCLYICHVRELCQNE